MVEKLFEKLFTDTQARERATKNGKNWASAAFGIGGGSCDDVAAWLEEAKEWSTTAEDMVVKAEKKLQTTTQRLHESKEQNAQLRQLRLNTAKNCAEKASEVKELKRGLKRTRSEREIYKVTLNVSLTHTLNHATCMYTHVSGRCCTQKCLMNSSNVGVFR